MNLRYQGNHNSTTEGANKGLPQLLRKVARMMACVHSEWVNGKLCFTVMNTLLNLNIHHVFQLLCVFGERKPG